MSACTIVGVIDQQTSVASNPRLNIAVDASGIGQKGSSWPGLRLIFPSSVAIRTRSLCEVFSAAPPHIYIITQTAHIA